ncbi:hypothetical protein EIN_301550 [Entamoeba invadens IP1]|uniref:Uncharacterized protein n=1 Tax=Entamoeba invadens IP1 TaxID=370355 RepID=A0A0A1U9Z5_ENTIV|nr:hypothetical protein EIN_301550 [Entamoeba invadens IP1]ELP89966.1 hypothetical protein EIN_301550 [Entamoeba invadens IP1]|eukprot:XP_004256737.1 hypothetical protein EIN_301550 [Entamoeba invadens IP1]
MSKLERVYLMNVTLYVNTVDSLKTFEQVNKKCFECFQSLFINPLINLEIETFALFKEPREALYSSIFNFIINAFPKIETLQCYDYMLGNDDKLVYKVKKIRIVKTPHNKNNYYKNIHVPHFHPQIVTCAIPKIENFYVGTKCTNLLPTDNYTNLKSVHMNGWIRNPNILQRIFELKSVTKITIWNCTHPTFLSSIETQIEARRMKKMANVKVSIFIEKTAIREILKKDFDVAIIKLKKLNVDVFDCEENVVDHCGVLDNSRFVGEVVITNVKGLDLVGFRRDEEVQTEDHFEYIGYKKWIELTRKINNNNIQQSVEQKDEQMTTIQNELIEYKNEIETQKSEGSNDNLNEENDNNTTHDEYTDEDLLYSESDAITSSQNNEINTDIPMTCPLVVLDNVMTEVALLTHQITILTLFNISNIKLSKLFATTILIVKCKKLEVSISAVDMINCYNSSHIKIVNFGYINFFNLKTSNNIIIENHAEYHIMSVVASNIKTLLLVNCIVENTNVENCTNFVMSNCEYGNVEFTGCDKVSMDLTNKQINSFKVKTLSFNRITNSNIYTPLKAILKISRSHFAQFKNIFVNTLNEYLREFDKLQKYDNEYEVNFMNGVTFINGKLTMVTFNNVNKIPFLENIDVKICNKKEIKEIFIEKARRVFINANNDVKVICGEVDSVVSTCYSIVYREEKYLKYEEIERWMDDTDYIVEVYGHVKLCAYYITYPYKDLNLNDFYYDQNDHIVINVLKAEYIINLSDMPIKRIYIERTAKFCGNKLILNNKTEFVDLKNIDFKEIVGTKCLTINRNYKENKYEKTVFEAQKKKTRVSWAKCEKIVCSESVEQIVVKTCDNLEEIVVGENVVKIHVQSCKTLKRFIGKIKGVQVVVKNCPLLGLNDRSYQKGKVLFLP